MARILTQSGGLITFDERVVDGDGDTLNVDHVELDTINGVEQTGGDRSPSWLSYSTTTNTLSSGASELIVTVELQPESLTLGTTYTWELKVTGSNLSRIRRIETNVRPGESEPSHFLYGRYSGSRKLLKIDNALGPNRSQGSQIDSFSLPNWSVDQADESIQLAGGDLGEYYVATRNNLYKLDAFGNLLWTNTKLSGFPRDVEVGTDGFIYAITDAGQLYKVGREGDLINQFGVRGDLSGAEAYVSVLENGKLWYSTSDRGDSVLYNNDGSVDFARSKPGNDRVGAIGARNGGEFLLAVGDNGDGAAAWDENGNTVFSSTSGAIQDAFEAVVLPSKDLFVFLSNDNSILVAYDFLGTKRWEASVPIFNADFGPGRLDLLTDELNNLYSVTEGDNGSGIRKFDSDGNILWTNRITSDGFGATTKMALARKRG